MFWNNGRRQPRPYCIKLSGYKIRQDKTIHNCHSCPSTSVPLRGPKLYNVSAAAVLLLMIAVQDYRGQPTASEQKIPREDLPGLEDKPVGN